MHKPPKIDVNYPRRNKMAALGANWSQGNLSLSSGALIDDLKTDHSSLHGSFPPLSLYENGLLCKHAPLGIEEGEQANDQGENKEIIEQSSKFRDHFTTGHCFQFLRVL